MYLNNSNFSKKKKLHKLEIGWNDRLAPSDDLTKLRLVASSSEELKSLLMRSAPESVELSTFSDLVQSKMSRPKPKAMNDASKTAYSSIATTFGFVHHKGTDHLAELKVLKCILIREGILNNIQLSCEPWKNQTNKYSVLQKNESTVILDYLTQIRDVTVDLIEMVCMWRLSMPNVDPDMPRPFLWEGENYLLRVISDLDFLAEIPPLVRALGISPSKMRVNPLMLPNTLSELSYKSTPAKLAAQDTHGITEGNLYFQRLRFRKAERVLMNEIEFNMHGIPSIDWEEDCRVTDEASGSVGNKGKKNRKHEKEKDVSGSNGTDDVDDIIQEFQENLTTWSFHANVQLKRLGDYVGERLHSTSTNRLDVPAPDKVNKISAKYSHTPVELFEPTKLTAFHSALHAAEDNSLYSLASVGSSRSLSPVRDKTASRQLLRKRFGLPSSSSEGGELQERNIAEDPDAFVARGAEGAHQIRVVQSGMQEGPASAAAADTRRKDDVDTPSYRRNTASSQRFERMALLPKGGATMIPAGREETSRHNEETESPRQDSREGLEEILIDDVVVISEIEDPPAILTLTSASIMVLVADNIKVSE